MRNLEERETGHKIPSEPANHRSHWRATDMLSYGIAANTGNFSGGQAHAQPAVCANLYPKTSRTQMTERVMMTTEA